MGGADVGVTRTMAGGITGLLVAAALTIPAFAVADSASVTVTFHIDPCVTAQAVDGGLLIRSNAPWQLVAESSHIDGTPTSVRESGPATGSEGTLIEAENLTGYTLVLETAR